VSEIVHARVQEHLVRLHLAHVAERLDALLSDAARKETTYLDFLDEILKEDDLPPEFIPVIPAVRGRTVGSWLMPRSCSWSQTLPA
jgi:hypothetical protein